MAFEFYVMHTWTQLVVHTLRLLLIPNEIEFNTLLPLGTLLFIQALTCFSDDGLITAFTNNFDTSLFFLEPVSLISTNSP